MSSTTCAHPACPGKPAAWLAYDYEGQCAWLDDSPGDGGQWALCKRHADSLRVPRGWFCIDRRAAQGHWEGWDGWSAVDGAALSEQLPRAAAGLGPAQAGEARAGAASGRVGRGGEQGPAKEGAAKQQARLTGIL